MGLEPTLVCDNWIILFRWDGKQYCTFVAKLRSQRKVGIPNYICGSSRGNTNVDAFSFGAAYLGSSYTPFTFTGDPTDPKFTIKDISIAKDMAARLEDRVQLLSGLDRLRRSADRSSAMNSIDRFNSQAIELMTSCE